MCVGSLSRGGERVRAGGAVDAKAQRRGCVLVSAAGPPDGTEEGGRIHVGSGRAGSSRPQHPRRRGGGGSFPQKEAVRVSLSRGKRRPRSCLNHSRKRGRGPGLGL